MLMIPCPWCGPRDEREFQFGGEADRVGRVAAGEAEADWPFVRENAKGRAREIWWHAHGCRRWLLVERDTAANRVLAARDASR